MAKEQWEIEARDRFLRYLLERQGQEYLTTGEDVVVNPLTRQNYDYELTPKSQGLPVIALEIFRVVEDEQDIEHHFTWIDITQRLRTELKARGVCGYLIRTPHFNIPKFRRKQFAAETSERLATAIAKDPSQDQLAVGDYFLYKLPGDAEVRFSHIGGVRAINLFGSVSDSLDDLLPTKNKQLNVQGRLRTLLIVNAGIFREEFAIRQYFSTKDPEQFPNVDRVFSETGLGNFSLAFDRLVFDRYRGEQMPEDEESASLLISFVEHRLSSDHKKAFELVKKIHQKYGTLDRLSVGGRDALVSCGEMFVEEGEWPSTLWIVEHLKNDPDPAFPSPMHDRLVEGQDNLLITSVRGRLCWLIQKVIVHNLIEHYSAMLDILEGYAFGPDFYIRSQSCVPLSEMATRRRSTLPDGRRFMPQGIAERTKDIAFRMLRNAGTNPALLDDVSSVLAWVRDLTEEEATEVIEKLSGVHGLYAVHARCGLLLYFALFRENQFADLPPFDSAKLRKRLHEELTNGDSKFRASLMWQMAGGAEDTAFPYEALRAYLESFVSGPYDEAGFLHLRRICEVHIKQNAESLCPIILRALGKLGDYIAAEPGPRGWNGYELWEYFDLLSEHCGEDCVLDSLTLMLAYKARIPGISGTHLATILGRYKSARAQELRARYRDALNA